MENYNPKYHSLPFVVYFNTLLLLAIGLPFSEILLSFAQIILAANWLLEGNFKNKWDRLRNNKPLLWFFAIYGVHLLWMLTSQDIRFGLHDLRIKLPLLVLPLIIGTSTALSKNEIYTLIRYFVISVVLASIVNTIIYFQTSQSSITHISYFVSHIRFALMIVFSITAMLYFLSHTPRKKWVVILTVTGIIWLLFYSFYFLRSLTGIGIFIILMFILGTIYALKIKTMMLRYFSIIGIITVFMLLSTFLTHSIGRFYHTDKIDYHTLPKLTKLGNPYRHNINDKTIENGHYIWLFVCEKELRENWNKLSKIPYDSINPQSGFAPKYTLIRYLTSKGLPKDADGISQLSPQDIKNIEHGISNYLFAQRLTPYTILYKLLWQIDVYRKNNECDGHTLTQRFEFWKTGIQIFSHNPWIGIGTGDIQDAFNLYYQTNETKLSPEHRYRSHNQLLTFGITFGIVGLSIILFGLFYPVFHYKVYRHFLILSFLLIILFSFLNEDTLETQTGVTFFIFFYSIFIFPKPVLNNE